MRQPTAEPAEPAVTLRPMVASDLPVIQRWLVATHVARWWNDDPGEQLAEFEKALDGRDPTHLLVVEAGGRPVGWCQWYRWRDYPEADEYGAGRDDIGIDYAIGDPGAICRGLGTAMIAALLAAIRVARPHAPVLVAVAAENAPSRRVLEKNGFTFVELRAIESEPEELSALYRLDAR